MIRNGSKTIFTLLLLLYFIGFAVSPVSAIFTSDQLDRGKQEDAFRQPSNHADLLFFDLALWEVLKRTKRSDDSMGVMFTEQTDKPSEDAISKTCDGATEHEKDLILFSESTIYHGIRFLSPYTTPQITHSGLSPPFRS
jgi:hypothetical protein